MSSEEVIIDIDCVKIIGKIRGIEKPVELLMDEQTFYEWKEKIKRE